MIYRRLFLLVILGFCALSSCKDAENTSPLQVRTVYIGTESLSLTSVTTGLPTDQPIVIGFSSPVDVGSAGTSISLISRAQNIDFTISFFDNNKSVALQSASPLMGNTQYTIVITNQLKGSSGEEFSGVEINFMTAKGSLLVSSLKIGGNEQLNAAAPITNIPRELSVEVTFSKAIDPDFITADHVTLKPLRGQTIPLQYVLSDENKKLTISSSDELAHITGYELTLSDDISGINEEAFAGLTKTFYTEIDPSPKLPLLLNDEDDDNNNANDLLSVVQQQTFKYFWDFAHPASGMARERNTSGDLVTSGGSGFGLMAIIVGVERNFITRQQGIERLDKILDFLETADRFHGAWSHWINGNSGDVIPFSPDDNGGDLVETAFLVEGLITFRQYLDQGVAAEQSLITRINVLWQSVEWDWYRRQSQDVLYWHWSPTGDWVMNHQIKGWNECLITYVLAASSPSHGIPKSVYTDGWASNGGIKNGNVYEGITLPLGSDYGGPLFFTHYSFLGFDPRDLNDTYANYWTQNVNHSLINYKYCVRNPKKFVGYSENCWGLTASDNQSSYAAHSPTNDLGVITPTAALSSFPYTPDESMKALKFFYYKLGDRLWGEYGFYDAFNITDGWTADSYLAIDQGPIIVMIENYRTGLLWDLFMSAPEVQSGATKLGFTY